MPAVGIGISPVLGGGNPVSLDPDYIVYEAAMSVAPSALWRAAVNQMILDIKTALSITSLSDAFDAMWFLAAETEQASRLNMVKRAHDCTATAAPTFEASRGVTGNGTTQFLDTNYNPATQGVRYTLNNVHIGIYTRTAGNTGFDVGTINNDATQRTRLQRISASNIVGNVNQPANTSTAFVSDYAGLFVVNRSASNATQIYQNGGSLISSSAASSSIPSLNVYILAQNNNSTADNFCTRQLALVFAGRSMDATQQASFYTAVQTAMTAIGANV